MKTQVLWTLAGIAVVGFFVSLFVVRQANINIQYQEVAYRLSTATPMYVENPNMQTREAIQFFGEWGEDWTYEQWATAWWMVDNGRGDLAIDQMSDHMTNDVWFYYRPLVQDLWIHPDEYVRVSSVRLLAIQGASYDMFRDDTSPRVQQTIVGWDTGEGVSIIGME